MSRAHSGAAAVAVHNHVDAAAAIHSLLERYEKDENLVKVDLEAGCVSLAWRAWRATWNGRAVHDSAGCIILSVADMNALSAQLRKHGAKVGDIIGVRLMQLTNQTAGAHAGTKEA